MWSLLGVDLDLCFGVLSLAHPGPSRMTDTRTQCVEGMLDTAEKKLRHKNHTPSHVFPCLYSSANVGTPLRSFVSVVAFVPIGDSSSYTASHSQPDPVRRSSYRDVILLDFCTSSSALEQLNGHNVVAVLFAVAVKILSPGCFFRHPWRRVCQR